MFVKVLSLCFCLAMGSIFGFIHHASAHAIIEFPAARPGSGPGNQTGPCGGPFAVASPTVIQAGSTITVTWEETIHHSGNFQFYFAPTTVTTQTGVLPMGIPSPIPSSSLLYAVPQTFTNSNTLPHQYTAQIKMPSTPCSNCTIQFFQVNSDVVAGTPTYPTPAQSPVYYFSCADVQLTAGAVAAPAPSPSVCVTPSPSPSATLSPVFSPTFTNVNAQIIQPLCISCHTTGNISNQNVSLANYAGVLATTNTANPPQSLIYQLTQEGPTNGGMPLSGQGLTAAQELLLLQWIQAGAPNN